MTCKLCKCKWYTVLIEDDDDTCGTPWCLLADDALPDGCFWPFDCVAELEEENEEGDNYEEDK